MIKIEEVLKAEGVTHQTLIEHWDADQYLSYHGSIAKMKAIPGIEKNKIAKVYKILRENGIYPCKPKDGKMTLEEIVTYQEGNRRIHPVPKSLAAMEPPERKSEKKDLEFKVDFRKIASEGRD